MPDLAKRTEMKKELENTVGKAYIQSQEADTATLRRAGVGDYRVAIDDRALKAEADQTQALMQTESDQTQVILNNILTAINSLNTSINAKLDTANAHLGQIETNTGGTP